MIQQAGEVPVCCWLLIVGEAKSTTEDVNHSVNSDESSCETITDYDSVVILENNVCIQQPTLSTYRLKNVQGQFLSRNFKGQFWEQILRVDFEANIKAQF